MAKRRSTPSGKMVEVPADLLLRFKAEHRLEEFAPFDDAALMKLGAIDLVVATSTGNGASETWRAVRIVDVATWKLDNERSYRVENVSDVKGGRNIGIRSAKELFPIAILESQRALGKTVL